MAVKMMCIAPHGDIIIPERRYYDQGQSVATAQSLLKLRALAREKRIDHFIVVDPHAHIVPGSVYIYNGDAFRGTLKRPSVLDKNACSSLYYSHKQINEKLRDLSHPKLQNKHNHHKRVYDLSWGSYVPLYMIAADQTVSIITVDPKMERSAIAEISNKIYEAAFKDERNIGIIFSADMSHAWSKSYKNFPYHSNSKVYDDHVIDIVTRNAIEDYRDHDDIVQTASTCAHGPLTMLSEICKNNNYKSKLLSHEVPTYFGMLVALIEPQDENIFL